METCRTQIAELAAGVRAQLPEQAYPMRIMQAISHHLFAEQGFRGNRQVSHMTYTPHPPPRGRVLNSGRLPLPSCFLQSTGQQATAFFRLHLITFISSHHLTECAAKVLVQGWNLSLGMRMPGKKSSRQYYEVMPRCRPCAARGLASMRHHCRVGNAWHTYVPEPQSLATSHITVACGS